MLRIFRHAATFAAAAACALSAACTDATGVTAPPAQPAPAPALAAIQCTVTVATAALRCDAPTPGGGVLADLIVGGQGTYVQLRASNMAYDSAAQVFSTDVSMQNLLGQPVGTEDGTTPGGIRVYFHTPPAATAGSGQVQVLNADGATLFTEAGQPYFSYPEILAPYERTAARQWRWSVPTSVQAFSFSVYVSAAVPNAQGVLRWTRERGDVVTRDLFALWGTGPSDMWAAGNGVMMYNNGTRWVVIPGEWSGVADIHGSSSGDVWAVGGGYGDVHHFNGRRWSRVPAINENWGGVWAQAPNNVYVTGSAFGNVIRWNGSAWQTVFSPSSGRRFWDVWGFGANDVFVTGGRWNTGAQRYDHWVWHWDGATWDSTAIAGAGALWGSSRTHLYTVGGSTIHRFDGGAWTRVDGGVTTYPLRKIWGTGPNDVWAVGGGYHGGGPEATVVHFDGVSWTEVQTGGVATAAAVYTPSPDKVYVLGYRGMIQKRSGGQWSAESSAVPEDVLGVAPVSESDVITASCGGLKRTTGPGGTPQTLYATPDCLQKVWVTPGATEIFAVGYSDEMGRNGVVVRWDGTQWTRTHFAGVTYLNGVWGLDAQHVYAVGEGNADGQQVPRVFRWDGAAWTEMATDEPYGQLYGVWGTSPNDLWAVGTVVLRWDGTRWNRQYVHEWGDSYRDVWGSGPNDVFLAGGRVAHWDGTQWTSFHPRNNYQGHGVWGSGPNDVYVVGTSNLHYNGSTWTEVNIETASTLYDIGGLTARQVWAAGAGGVVMRGRR